MSKMLSGQGQAVLWALPDSWLWPSASFSTRCPRAIRQQSRDGKPSSPSPCLTNCRMLKGETAILQIHSSNSTWMPSSFPWEGALCFGCIVFWMTPPLPLSKPLDPSVWTNLYLSNDSKEQTDGPWVAKMLCSQTKLFYTVHITLDSLAQSTPACQ